MGREIRKVPPNWEHPKNRYGEYENMFDKTFEVAFDKWMDEYKLWENGEHPDKEEGATNADYVDWNGTCPSPEGYRPEFTEEPTWFQVYETVSEGTPITPPFETKEELVEHLVENGTSWDQRRANEGRQEKAGWRRESAEGFANIGWSPSGMLVSTPNGNEYKTPRDMEYPK